MKKREKLELKDVVRNVLEEARMVLPGIQALFGFQLVAVFNASFKDIPTEDHILHLIALMLTICCVACLMAPASYHRQVERDEVSSDFVEYASKLICIGMLPLSLSISLDTYVVTNVITKSPLVAGITAGASFLVLSILWFAVPQIKKASLKHNRSIEMQVTEPEAQPFSCDQKLASRSTASDRHIR
jgi:Family of unknown function (DUF6328)